MWYFTWMLGLTMAVLLAVLNAMWHDLPSEKEGKL
jgi:cyd operon protein YbgT